MPTATRIGMFERNFLWHMAGLAIQWVYVFGLFKEKALLAVGPIVYLFVFPVLVALRVRAASMLDQRKAFCRTSHVWLVSMQTCFVLTLLSPSTSADVVHSATQDVWLIVFLMYNATFKGAADALLADPETQCAKLARSVFAAVLVIKVVQVRNTAYTLFWLGFAVTYEVSYQLTNEYIDSRAKLAALSVRNDQLEREKDRLNFERRIQRKQLDGSDEDSSHDANVVGALLGTIQDAGITAKQQELARSVDTGTSPTTVMALPLFTMGGAPPSPAAVGGAPPSPAAGWHVRETSPQSDVTSCASSVVQSIEQAQQKAEITWAPRMPSNCAADDSMKIPPFRRRRRGSATALMPRVVRPSSAC